MRKHPNNHREATATAPFLDSTHWPSKWRSKAQAYDIACLRQRATV
jgi:hypothetical protein